MRKITGFLVVGLLIFSAGLVFANGSHESTATASKPQQAKVYNWKFATEECPVCYETRYANEFAKRMKNESNGQVNIEVYPLGTLGTGVDALEACSAGSIQFVISSPGVAATVVPQAQFLLLHYIFSDNMAVNDAIYKNWRNDPAFEAIAAAYAKKNAKVLSYWHEGWMAWTSNKPITSPSDFKGMKFRTMESPLIIATYRAYGANPTPMPWGQVYNGLQLGIIDGQENPYYYLEANKLEEVQKYMIEAKTDLFTDATIVSRQFFLGLPKNLQDMIVTTADQMFPWAVKMQNDLNSTAIANMKKENPNFKVIKLTPAQIAKFREASLPVRQKYIDMMSNPAQAKKDLDALLQAIKTEEQKLGSQ